MKIDKLKVVLITSFVFFVVSCAFYLSTYLPSNGENDRLNQLKSDLNAVTDPQSGATDITRRPYSRDAASEISETDGDRISRQLVAEDVQINQHSENLTEADILMLIAELEKQSKALLQEEEEKSRLAFKLQDEDEALFQAYEIEFELVKAHHDAIEAEFEREVLGGRSVHDVVTTASDEELEKLRAHPLSQVLTEACLQYHEVVDTFTAQSHANVDKMNALHAEASELHLRNVEIEKDIADLKAMLQ